MSNPNPAFIIVPAPFGAYSGQLSASLQPGVPSVLVTPGVAGGYQYISNGPANSNNPDPENVPVGK
jgi:hypothetical protein